MCSGEDDGDDSGDTAGDPSDCTGEGVDLSGDLLFILGFDAFNKPFDKSKGVSSILDSNVCLYNEDFSSCKADNRNLECSSVGAY